MRPTTMLAALTILIVPLGVSTAALPAAAAETCDGKVATIVIPAPPGEIDDGTSTDPVTGTPGDDVIVGTDAIDTIDGAGGNDTICGLAGSDTIRGGEGNDRLFGGLDGLYYPGETYYWGDVIVPGPGDDHVDLGADDESENPKIVRGLWDMVSYADAAGPVTVDLAAGTATGEGSDTIVAVQAAAGIEGSQHDDVLLGSDADDLIQAGGGNDRIEGRGGQDTLQPDLLRQPVSRAPVPYPGDDWVEGGPGHDDIEGGYGTDTLNGGPGRDQIRVHEGTGAVADGGAGSDVLGGNDGWATKGTGAATYVGGAGNDRFEPTVGRRSDRVTLRGNAGRDLLSVLPFNGAVTHGSTVTVRNGTWRSRIGKVVRFAGIEDHLFTAMPNTARIRWWGTGKAERVRVQINKGGAHLYGRGGNDTLRGSHGRDLIDGGPGRDSLHGGGGTDRCLRGEVVKKCERRG